MPYPQTSARLLAQEPGRVTAFAAAVFVALTAVVVGFQVALILGAPWGHLTMGGQISGALPIRLRVLVAIQALLLMGLAAIVLASAGVALVELRRISRRLVWVPVAISGLSLALNLATPSEWERLLWSPVALLMLVSSSVVAFTRRAA